MCNRVKTEHETLSLQIGRNRNLPLVIRPAVMVPVFRVVLLIVVRCRHRHQLCVLPHHKGISRLLLISQFKIPYSAEIYYPAHSVLSWIQHLFFLHSFC